MKNVLVIGSGGREHALVWKLSQSKHIDKIFVSPGNAGTQKLAINVPYKNNLELITFAKKNNIHLTVVGPDNALAGGVVDQFQKAGLKVFGPTKRAAEIEWSKSFAKKIMAETGIPTAQSKTFKNGDEALVYLKSCNFPKVVKADGLALGKGVFICNNYQEAAEALGAMPSQPVIVEEYLSGKEFSAHAICNGRDFILFPFVQDHKRIGDNNTGPNTGGMGTICPVQADDKPVIEIISKTLASLKKSNQQFTGCLFPGLMSTDEGLRVLEFNARFGDPETEVLMRLMDSDLFELLEAAVDGQLTDLSLKWANKFAVCVILSSGGYPGRYKVGYSITGIEEAEKDNMVVVFHCGTEIKDNVFVTNGGRVLAVTATGDTVAEARKRAYAAADIIQFEGKYFRTDIGLRN